MADIREKYSQYIADSLHYDVWLLVVLFGISQLCEPFSWCGCESRVAKRPHGLLITPLQLWSVEIAREVI